MNIDYKITKSNRKTIALKILPQGDLEVVAPKDVSDEKIKKVVEKKRFWIYKNIHNLKEKNSNTLKKEFRSGELFWYLGRRYRLDVTDCEHRGLRFHYGKFVLNIEDRQKAKQLFKEFYKQKAKEKFQSRIIQYAKQMGVEFREFKVLDMKKRWGSCTKDGNIIINYHLIKAPLYVADYVIVHELAHLIEYNHSKRFWNIVKTQIRDYEIHKKWLDKLNTDI